MIRPATPQDATACAGILSDWVAETPWFPKLHTRDQDLAFVTGLLGREAVTVAQIDGQIAGFMARNDTQITQLFLAAPHRGQGLGERLLRVAQSARNSLSLWTFQANTGARRFYARHGFAEVETTAGDNMEKLPDVRLEWRRS